MATARYLLCAGLLASGMANADVPPPGRLLASQCAQCHGTAGHSYSRIDSLAGEGAGEIYEEMVEMKYGGDTGIMDAHARGYSDHELRLVADWFGSQSTYSPDEGQNDEKEEDDHDD